MGFYTDRILPRITNRFMAGDEFVPHRRDCLEGVSGEVLEVGFGSGLNLPYYPSDVRKLYALDPATLGRKLAAERLAGCPFPVEFVGLDGEDIPLADNIVDAAVCTWTLCSIPDPSKALREIRRVLKPGHRFHFVEHGRSDEERVARWQDRLTPFHRVISGGCHLNRKIDALVREAGFEIERLENLYICGAKISSYFYKGRAVSPSTRR
jgi:ubiquinone/menaquinone biosynthesis C-methylase UbiE